MKTISLYAAILAIFFVILSVRTILLRRRLKINLGDGGNAAMLRAMRVQANFAEYVPFALVLLGLLAAQGADAPRLHFLGAVLCIARISHAYGVSQAKEIFIFRIIGVAGTFTVLLSSATELLWKTWS